MSTSFVTRIATRFAARVPPTLTWPMPTELIATVAATQSLSPPNSPSAERNTKSRDDPGGSLKSADSALDTLRDKHKGSAGGRIGVVGGSHEYVGAPYYVATSALTCGADLATIISQEAAAVPLKSLSPEFIVHPVNWHKIRFPEELVQSPSSTKKNYAKRPTVDFEEIETTLERLHALVVGPGLGRDPDALASALRVIAVAREQDLPVVIDGDGLFALCAGNADSWASADALDTVRGYSKCVLTPNAVEFGRLCKVAGVELPPGPPSRVAESHDALLALGERLGGVTVMQKGLIDKIYAPASGSQKARIISNPLGGSPRRCGGQGDVLAGSIATLLAWSSLFAERTSGKEDTKDWPLLDVEDDSPISLTAASSLCASILVRQSAAAAFESHRRSTTTPHILVALEKEVDKLFPSRAGDQG